MSSFHRQTRAKADNGAILASTSTSSSSSTASSSPPPSVLYSQARLRPVQRKNHPQPSSVNGAATVAPTDNPTLTKRSIGPLNSLHPTTATEPQQQQQQQQQNLFQQKRHPVHSTLDPSTRSTHDSTGLSLLKVSEGLSSLSSPASSASSCSSSSLHHTQTDADVQTASTSSTSLLAPSSYSTTETSPALSVKTIKGDQKDDEDNDDMHNRIHDFDYTSTSYLTASGMAYAEDGEDDKYSDDAHLSAAASSDEEAEGPEEYVVALHDFSSNNATCLSFESGQVIRVFNRDESGWWDGELNGQRGWFPSNYVDEGGISDLGHSSSSAADEHTIGANEGFRAHWTGVSETSAPSSNSQHTATLASTAAPRTATRHPSRSPTPTANNFIGGTGGTTSHKNDGAGGSVATVRGKRSSNLPNILEPIHHAISLLHNAVRANRVAHFQPSTACVISSVRSVLSSTDCLTRESAVLRAHPSLAKERKQILAELSKLVTQARKASSFSLPAQRTGEEESDEEEARLNDMEQMLRMADQVLLNVRRFLDVAVQSGLSIPDKRTSVYDDLTFDSSAPLSHSRFSQRHNGSAAVDRNDSDKTPTPDSPRSSTYRTAYTSDPPYVSPRSSRSYVDLRGSMLPPPAHTHHALGGAHSYSQAHAHNAHNTDHQAMTQAARVKAQALASQGRTAATTSNAGQTNGPTSPNGSDSDEYSPNSSSEGSAGDGGVGEQQRYDEGPIPLEPRECGPSEIMERIQHANDHLLSIIAAFIGHIHGHTRNSHASSYAFLIDMTRATVDGVRTLLAIVEAVHACQVLQIKLPKQTSILWETRESVYEATASLVTAARVITSPNSSASSAHGSSSIASHSDACTTSGGEGAASPSLGGEDVDKSKLLQAATAVLRTGGECVGAVKLCLNRADSSLRITLAMPTSMHAAQTAMADAGGDKASVIADDEDEEEAAGERHLQEVEQPSRRGKNTLSYLGRKATSLSGLREQYIQRQTYNGREEEATSNGRFDDIAEMSVESVEEHATDATHSDRLNAGTESSDSSEPMSRDHSRASASTLHSSASVATPNTSARPSFDRGDGSVAANAAAALYDGQSATHSAQSSRHDACVPPHIRNRSVSLPKGVQEAIETELPPSPAVSSSPSFPSPPKKVGRSLSSDARILAPDYDASEICFNSEGQLTGATLKALVEKMTPHNTTTDATLSNAFFLCFRLFTSPLDLFEAIEARYNMRPHTDIELHADDFTRWTELKVAPIRLRVFNFLKVWLENHWHAATDFVILEPLLHFSQTSMAHSLNKPGQRLAELAQRRIAAGPAAKVTTVAVNAVSLSRGPGTLKRMVSSDRVKNTPGFTEITNLYTPSAMSKTGISAPPLSISKSLLNHLKTLPAQKINVMDFDPLELARQITVMESRIYCSILPEELLGQEFSKKADVSGAVHIKRMSAMSTHITGWVSECILSEDDARKRTQLVRFFIKLGDRCLGLNNFNALFAIQGALNSSTIARLKRTWDGLPTKYRQLMEQQRYAVEHTRNFAGYRQRLRSTLAPALPFVGLFLTDLTFCHEGNAATRPSPSDPTMRLINFDKYVKMSRIICDLQRFQHPYALMEVPEVQKYLHDILESSHRQSQTLTAEELYRRSLRLEPRNGSQQIDANTLPHSSGTITNRGGLGSVGMDIFNWK